MILIFRTFVVNPLSRKSCYLQHYLDKLLFSDDTDHMNTKMRTGLCAYILRDYLSEEYANI